MLAKSVFQESVSMFDHLSQRLAKVVKTMRGEARITETNSADMLREVRLALLEADVALPVVREFMARVKERALGEEVVGSLTPGQALVGVVQKELTQIIGGSAEGKLAKWLKEKHKKKVLVVSADIYRPAAIQQLQTVASQVDADFFPSSAEQAPVAIAQAAIQWAKTHYHDVLIVDTAGRLAVDEAMMSEIRALHQAIAPAETLFVVDAMTGQDAVNTAKAFAEALPLTGIVLTKLDGDARGGAALSVRFMTGQPIKFVGVGEKLDGLEPFYPERMAQRILGMGDILALVEEAQKSVDMAEAQKMADKLKKGGGFDLNDFKMQMSQMKKMGGLSGLIDKLPAHMQAAAGQANMGMAEKQVRRMEGIINAMTPQERSKPELIKASRKRRIATGAGVPVQEVNRLLNQFDQVQGMMKKMQKGGMAKMLRGMKGMMGKGAPF
jgi:signal recognition particle subunit SRP54